VTLHAKMAMSKPVCDNKVFISARFLHINIKCARHFRREIVNENKHFSEKKIDIGFELDQSVNVFGLRVT